jgi:hypothetical protein
MNRQPGDKTLGRSGFIPNFTLPFQHQTSNLLHRKTPVAEPHGRGTGRKILRTHVICIQQAMGLELDEQSKAGINFRRHGVHMPEAIPVFDDPYAITITGDQSDPNEQRSSLSALERWAAC